MGDGDAHRSRNGRQHEAGLRGFGFEIGEELDGRGGEDGVMGCCG